MKHIAIGICSYRNPEGLRKLLESFQTLPPSGYHVRVIVVENGVASDEYLRVVRACHQAPFSIEHVVEQKRSIVHARNRCIEAALISNEDALIFVDDDEYAHEKWLDSLTRTWETYGSDIVRGRAVGIVPEGSPRWALTSRLYGREERREGQSATHAPTHNLLIAKAALKPAFHPAFAQSGGSDYHWSRCRVHEGHQIVSSTSVIYEDIPKQRVNLWWAMRRSFRIGASISVARKLLNQEFGTRHARITVALARIVVGLARALVALPVMNQAKVVDGFLHMVKGVGGIAGTFGFSWNEYGSTSYR